MELNICNHTNESSQKIDGAEPLLDKQEVLRIRSSIEAARHHAFVAEDIKLSKDSHASYLGSNVPKDFKIHLQNEVQTTSQYMKSAVFGALDGITTIVCIIAGCLGAQLTASQILIVGIGNLFANAFSMGFGEYVSSIAEYDRAAIEQAREEWEMINCPEEEKLEMYEIYIHRYGMSHDDAANLVNTTFKYHDFFLSHMLVEEIGIFKADTSTSSAIKGIIMFCSFVISGVIPLTAFSVCIGLRKLHLTTPTLSEMFAVTFAAGGAALFLLGVLKAEYVRAAKFTSGVKMLFNGSCAGIIAFSIGTALQKHYGVVS